jgi:hypothetical protein
MRDPRTGHGSVSAHGKPSQRISRRRPASLARAANARRHALGAALECGETDAYDADFSSRDAYESTFPIRRGNRVTISNIPTDLTAEDAEHLASFLRMLDASE